jgi:hypothetical protein
MNKTLKLKAEFLSTDGGRTFLLIHQYFLTDPATRTFLNNTLEGRTFTMNNDGDKDGKTSN